MSDVESFVRFCESEFERAVMDREATYVKQHLVEVTRSSFVPAAPQESCRGDRRSYFPRFQTTGNDRSPEVSRARTVRR